MSWHVHWSFEGQCVLDCGSFYNSLEKPPDARRQDSSAFNLQNMITKCVVHLPQFYNNKCDLNHWNWLHSLDITWWLGRLAYSVFICLATCSVTNSSSLGHSRGRCCDVSRSIAFCPFFSFFVCMVAEKQGLFRLLKNPTALWVTGSFCYCCICNTQVIEGTVFPSHKHSLCQVKGGFLLYTFLCKYVCVFVCVCVFLLVLPAVLCLLLSGHVYSLIG